jgi:ribosomal protein S18 acetylase RimI-like enzyme/organic hydroperoxide reductase OsmC/OhrA
VNTKETTVHRARVLWNRGEDDIGAHTIELAGQRVAASGAPEFGGDPGKADPEEMFVASLSSCHMLWFLALARAEGVKVTSYEDEPEGTRIRTGEELTEGYAPRLAGDGVTMRRCRRSDVAAVLDLWAQARSEHASTADRRDEVERLVVDSPAALLVAERGGEIVGALIAAWDGWRGNMYRLAVRDGHRRQGIGLALVRAGEDDLRQRGARRVTALVAFDDRDAGGFWDAAGYPQDEEIGRRVRNI